MPLKGSNNIAVGRVIGPYDYHTDLPEGVRHVRPVQWIQTGIPRTAFGQDLILSFGSLLAICRVERNNAEQRIRAIAAGQLETTETKEGAPAAEESHLDLPGYARDEAKSYISQHFTGHALADLVDEVLRSQGFRTLVSPPGPDGGVDILSGRGPMGFDQPRFCVQVKSGGKTLSTYQAR